MGWLCPCRTNCEYWRRFSPCRTPFCGLPQLVCPGQCSQLHTTLQRRSSGWRDAMPNRAGKAPSLRSIISLQRRSAHAKRRGGQIHQATLALRRPHCPWPCHRHRPEQQANLIMKRRKTLAVANKKATGQSFHTGSAQRQNSWNFHNINLLVVVRITRVGHACPKKKNRCSGKEIGAELRRRGRGTRG